jgi:pimeloyl-ACP methyl ester carboxylesterase
MKLIPLARAGLAFAFAWLCLACAGSSPGGVDPVASDPPGTDLAHPARLAEVAIDSHGVAMNAIVYVAEGAGPHPTALLLHGFPGNERNLDLAQAVRRSGWNAVFFHYRGAWGSAGDFSFGHALEDVAAAVVWTQQPANASALRIDPERIAVIGHSMGGFAALRIGGELVDVDCVASLAGANLASRGYAAQSDPELARAIADQLQLWSAPLSGTSGAALVAELSTAGTDFDLLRQVPALAAKPVLLVAGARDETTPVAEHHAPLVAALRAAGARSLSDVVLDADHAFSQRRVALARIVTRWLAESCRP